MVSLIKKSIYVFCVSLIMIAFSYGCSNNINPKESDMRNDNSKKLEELQKALQELQLNIAVVVSNKETSPRLAFIAKNKGKNDITVPEFGYTANRIEILKPNSQQPISPSGDNRLDVVIKPFESKIWYVNVAELFERYQEEGFYRIKWKIYDEVSPEEILLLREKDKIVGIQTNTQ